MKDIIILIFKQLVKEMKSHPVTLIVIFILSGGMYWFYSTHALADDLNAYIVSTTEVQKEFKGRLDLVVELQLAETISNLYRRWCVADQAGKQILREALNRYRSEYFKVTGRPFLSPACAEIV